MTDSVKSRVPVFVRYDDIRSSDGSLRNGGFETVETDGVPRWWSLSEAGAAQDTKASVLSEGSLEGERSARVTNSSKYVQSIPLKAGFAVTISFHYRSD